MVCPLFMRSIYMYNNVLCDTEDQTMTRHNHVRSTDDQGSDRKVFCFAFCRKEHNIVGVRPGSFV